mmetsp:Transcript_52430/g.170216  ORF Transcript_52430/g.170216 Transcript_52430/m.170216 type:complete len:250 (+) Transcript_52430:3-752(+)
MPLLLRVPLPLQLPLQFQLQLPLQLPLQFPLQLPLPVATAAAAALAAIAAAAAATSTAAALWYKVCSEGLILRLERNLMVVVYLHPLHGGAVGLHLAIRRVVVVPSPVHDAATGLQHKLKSKLAMVPAFHQISIQFLSVRLHGRLMVRKLLENPANCGHAPPDPCLLNGPSVLLRAKPQREAAGGVEQACGIEPLLLDASLKNEPQLAHVGSVREVRDESCHLGVLGPPTSRHLKQNDLLRSSAPLDAE